MVIETLQTISENSAISSTDIALALSISDRGVRVRASRENWKKVCMNTKGGSSHMYFYSMLPPDVRKKLVSHKAKQNSLSVIKANKAPAVSLPKANAPDKSKEIGLAKYQLVHAFRKAIKAAAWGKKTEASEAFVLAYNSQRLLPNVYMIVGYIAEKTLRALDKKLQASNDDYTALCDGRGGWKKHGTTKWKKRKLPEEAKKIVLQCYLQPTQPSAALAIKAARITLQKQNVELDCEDSTIRRWLNDYSDNNAHIVTIARRGVKAYKDEYGPYATRDASLLEPGQCLVADGKVLNFQVLHPTTGKPCRMALIIFVDWASRFPVGWQIMPTENTIAIAAAFRNAVVTLGRYPDSIYTDNGRAFKAKVFMETNPDLEDMTGLYARVGTAVHFAAPYNGRAKVVERLNLTFQEQCEKLIPSSCGTSIETKPAWMHRNEKFHKAWHQAKTNGWIPNMREAARIIDSYMTFYSNQPHKGLDGQTPREILEPFIGPGVPADQLSYDFMFRKAISPRRCRLTLHGIEYEADFLHGLSKSNKVIVMYDYANIEQVYCYTKDNQYLGEAYPVQAIHPLAKQFGTELDLYRVKEANKKQAKMLKTAKNSLLALGARDEDVEELRSLPYNQKVPVLIDHAKQPEAALTQIQENTIDEAEVKRLELVIDQAAEEMNQPEQVERPVHFATEFERYEWCFKVKFQQRLTLGNEDEAYMQYFETTNEYKTSYKNRFEDLKELYGMYGNELKQVNA